VMRYSTTGVALPSIVLPSGPTPAIAFDVGAVNIIGQMSRPGTGFHNRLSNGKSISHLPRRAGARNTSLADSGIDKDLAKR